MSRACAFACAVLLFACQPPTSDTETQDAGVESVLLDDAGTVDAGAPILEGGLALWLTGADSTDPLVAGQSRELFFEVSGVLRSSRSSARFTLDTQVDPGFGQVSPVADVTFSGLDRPAGTGQRVSTTFTVRLTPSGGAPMATVRVTMRPAQTGCENWGVCPSLEFPVTVGQGLSARALGGLEPLVVSRDQVERPQGRSLLVHLRNGSSSPRSYDVSGTAPTDWAVEDGESVSLAPGETGTTLPRIRWTGAARPTVNVTHPIRVEVRSGAETEAATVLLTVTP